MLCVAGTTMARLSGCTFRSRRISAVCLRSVMVPFEQLPIYTWAEQPSKETPHLDYPHPRKGGSALVHCMSSSGARSLKSHPFIGMFARDDLGSLTTARLEEAEALAGVV